VEGIVDQETFDQAQNLFQNQTIHKTNADLLSSVRRLLQEHGSVSEKLLNESRDLPSAEPYVRRFGSLSEAFEKIGYIGSQLAPTRAKRRVRAMRTQIVRQVIATDPTRITLVQPDGHFRPRFRVSGLLVSLYLCGCSSRRDGQLCWLLNTVRRERNCIALIVRLNHGNETIMDMFMVSDARSHTRYKLAADDPWLRRGKRLSSFDNFLGDVRLINVQRKHRLEP
jgi:hypothetical protein